MKVFKRIQCILLKHDKVLLPEPSTEGLLAYHLPRYVACDRCGKKLEIAYWLTKKYQPESLPQNN